MRVSSGSGPANPSLTSWSMAARKAAKVLPDPVGAATRTCCPDRSAGHARSCAGVGASKVRENQAATAGWNESRAFMMSAAGAPSITLRDKRCTAPGTPDAVPYLLSLDDLLQVIETALIHPTDGIHRGFVVFVVR